MAEHTVSTSSGDIFSDLAVEYERLDALLASLTPTQWNVESGAPGWTIADVVSHLAQTEAGVITTLTQPSTDWTTRTEHLDKGMDDQVRQAAWSGPEAFQRWRYVAKRSVSALRDADPDQTVRWAAAPLRPRTLATTRLAEHWAHGLDITEPLGIPFPDTDRLRHIAWLGHATLPYAFGLHSESAQPIRVELVGPGGDTWTYGPSDAASRITGAAGAFCRVGAQRLSPAESALHTEGPHADTALRVLRNYAA
jgi:uncharacterized protein (TIGR03084 family)